MTPQSHTQVARERADIAALTAQAHADATGTHAQLAPMVWDLLRSLGAPVGGRALAFGVDPRVLLTGDPNHREPRDADGFPVHDRWQGLVPGARPDTYRDAVPVTRYPLRLAMARPFDVAVASMPYSDIHLRGREARAMRLHSFHIQATEALEGLAPGGHAVFLANHSVLDFPDPSRWARLAQMADFLGAVRLPSHALRTAPACDAPVDILVLRRRETPHPAPGLRFPAVQWSPTNELHESTYFSTHPDRVLGTRDVGTDYWGMKQLAVHDPDHTWPGRLDAEFGEIARQHGSDSTTPGLAQEHGRPAPRHDATHPREEPPGLHL
ncbi:hypothetical protein APR04_001752 [Promicromonospora umidemergens]|uniref:Uncharacterized protein n=1 Tax=Promicromonospora umidemergens TaxID=629679 RepID=A0ABP8XGU9_9MICO|nr:hypothetical protein [Promicromonospora umidemergens]MCP2282849.1 hypothetical protein [Promicromonospora umidemergens]